MLFVFLIAFTVCHGLEFVLAAEREERLVDMLCGIDVHTVERR